MHDGIRMPPLRRNHVLDEHLALRNRAVGHLLRADADPEAALVGESHRRRLAIHGGTRRRRRGRERVDVGRNPRRRRLHRGDRDDALYKRRPGNRGRTREQLAVAMRDEDGRADVVDDHRAARSPQLLRDGVVRHRLVQRRHGLGNLWIVDVALRLGGDFLEGRRLHVKEAVHERLVRIPSLSRTVDDVHLVAGFEKTRHPSARRLP